MQHLLLLLPLFLSLGDFPKCMMGRGRVSSRGRKKGGGRQMLPLCTTWNERERDRENATVGEKDGARLSELLLPPLP